MVHRVAVLGIALLLRAYGHELIAPRIGWVKFRYCSKIPFSVRSTEVYSPISNLARGYGPMISVQNSFPALPLNF